MKVYYGFDLANELSWFYEAKDDFICSYYCKWSHQWITTDLESVSEIVDFPGYENMKCREFKRQEDITPFLEKEYPEIWL